MKQYLLSIYQPDGDIPAPAVLGRIWGEVQAVEEDLRAAGAWVCSGGLHAPNTATVLDPWEERHPPAELDALRPSGNQLGQLMFTSGTTGEPKGVMHTFDTVWTGARAPSDRLGLGVDEVVLVASPATHQLGFLYGVIIRCAWA
jgi:acyl-CoA synthetase (AMP-forming)/AMP-acid ligase II